MAKTFIIALNLVFSISAFSYQVDFIGDSHSDYYGNARGAFGFLGQHLKELMAAKGYSFALYGASGSSPYWWFDNTPTQAAFWGYTQTSPTPKQRTCTKYTSRSARTGTCVPKLSVILANLPDLFIIEQGTNLLGMSSSSIIQQINQMTHDIQNKTRTCLWVGAPNARTSVHSQSSQNTLWDLINTYASKYCYVYDSRFLPRTDSFGKPLHDARGNLIIDVPLPYSPDANNDGEHLGMSAAGKWAEGVAMMVDYIQQNRLR